MELSLKEPVSFESRKNEIESAVQYARANAIDNKFFEKYEKLASKSRLWEFETKELEKYLARLEKAIVFVHSIPEYRLAMQYAGFTSEEITATLAHENTHSVQTDLESHIDHSGLGLCFLDGGQVIPFVGNQRAKGVSTLDYLISSKRILNAPKVLGDELSEGDISDLESTEQLLRVKKELHNSIVKKAGFLLKRFLYKSLDRYPKS